MPGRGTLELACIEWAVEVIAAAPGYTEDGAVVGCLDLLTLLYNSLNLNILC